ncbi:hypothetical protein [Trichothermofontia sp.]
MMLTSPKVIYHNLNLLERVDAATSAVYRELAQEAITDPDISLNWRQAISDRLNRANVLLGIQATDGTDSY